MPPKKRNNPPVAVEPSKMKVGDLKEELEKLGLETAGKKVELVLRLEDAMKSGPSSSKKLKVEPPAVDVDYSKMKVTELKKELELQGLDTAGKKAELVARLEAGGGATGGAVKKETKKKADKPKTVKDEPTVEPMEETDFSKAKRALASARSDKKKVPKQRKVDSHCSVRSTKVVGDWDCMLNQTNIGQNNNKYYVIQLLQASGSFYVFTRWGRVGESGQQACNSFAIMEEAEKEFKKKFSDKTKNKWDSRDNFMAVPGKYTLLEMDDEDEGNEEELTSKLAALDEPDSGPAKVRPCTLNMPTQNLVKLIFNTDTFNNAMKALEIDTKKMPLGKLSRIQIAKGFEALEAIEEALDACVPRSKLAELTSKFYTIIPHDVGRRIPPTITDKEVLQKKFDMLVILGDIELAQGMQKDQAKKTVASDVNEVPHQLDVQYDSLKADMESLDTSSHEYQVIQNYMKATEPQWKNLRLQHVWRVNRGKVEDRFSQHKGLGNRRLLWHGTNVAVVAAILKSGLRIMPHSSGRVGKGIYLASENSKSAGYVRCSADGTGIMFLNEAALGKEHLITMDDWTLTSPPTGYDSILAKGRTEPDPVADIVLTLDGKPVHVPQGRPIPTSYNSSNFSQSEYLVYKESQTRIRYMLQIKFA